MFLGVLLDTLPTDIWHDPLFLGLLGAVSTVLAGLLGVAITYYVYRRQRSKKELTYQIVSDAPIASIDPSVASRVRLSIDGKQVESASQVVLKLWNSGNVAVKPEDYDEPVTFEFNGRAMISTDIIGTDPPELRETLQQALTSTSQTSPPQSINFPKVLLNLLPHHKPHELGLHLPKSINLPKVLLNPKRSITLSVLLTGSGGKNSAKASIVDGELVEFNPEKQQAWKLIPRAGQTLIFNIPFVISEVCSLAIILLYSIIRFSSEPFPTFSRIYSTIVTLAVILAFFDLLGGTLTLIFLLRLLRRRWGRRKREKFPQVWTIIE